MSIRSKFRQFVNWLREQAPDSNDPAYWDPALEQPPAGNDTWNQGESAGKQDEINEGMKYVVTLGDFYAGWLDAKTGQGSPPAQGVVTNDANLDGWVISGVLGILGWMLLKKLFA